MAATVLVDAGFLVALLNKRDKHNRWAAQQAALHMPPWHTCEAVLSEAFHLIGPHGRPKLAELLTLDALRISFAFSQHREPALALMQKYARVPMSFADACLVRMSEVLPNPLVLTVDSDFGIYRRHGRQTIPCALPS